MDHFESMRTALRETVFASLRCEAAPVRLALFALFGDEAEPVRALALDALAGEPSPLRLGAAIELIDAGLRRLHGDLDQAGTLAFDLGAAATVLTGDYLTSGAFKLLVEHGDMAGMQLVAAAAVQASQTEAAEAGNHAAGDEAQVVARHRARAEPLGRVAGEAGAALAGHTGDLREAAAAFGASLATAQSLLRAARHVDAEPERSALLMRAAAEVARARGDAQTLARHTGNERPLHLCDWLQRRIDVVVAG
ncbi:MAG: hypothetical protein JWP52_3754 [Rhizobacter sp.]|nr:hypothetical protein [Rhizobacter sp.]